jgi:hypothetical protein
MPINMNVERALAAEYVQKTFPELGSTSYKAILFDLTRNKPLIYPQGDQQVKEKLTFTGVALDKHERYAHMWRVKVRQQGVWCEWLMSTVQKRRRATDQVSDPTHRRRSKLDSDAAVHRIKRQLIARLAG